MSVGVVEKTIRLVGVGMKLICEAIWLLIV